MDDKTRALQKIHVYVLSGFYDENEILEIIDECVFEPGTLDRRWIKNEVQMAFHKMRAEESTWPRTTDCDRLNQVFAELEEKGIIALQDAGNTQSDGISDVTQIYHEAGGKESDVVGYCFYTFQDIEKVIETGDLCLTYGDISGDKPNGVTIGRQILHSLEATGFDVEWDGNVTSRLLVRHVHWQRRRPSRPT